MRRLAAVVWLAIVLAAAAYLGPRIHEGLPLATDILALLPHGERDPVMKRAGDEVAALLGRQVVVLVGHADRAKARAAAATIGEALRSTGLVEAAAPSPGPAASERIGRTYFEYRHGLLADADRERLADGRADEIARRALAQAYGFVGFGGSDLLRQDPFLLFPAFLAGLAAPSSLLAFDDGMLTAQADGKIWVFLPFQLMGAPYAMDTQERLGDALDREIATLGAATPGLETLRLGTVFFSRAGAEQAVHEISKFSTISLVGTVAIVLLVFRAIGPLWQSLLTIAVGLLCAFTASLLIFPNLHVTVLLFGSSLIGVTVDYSTHWFCASYDETAAGPDQRLRHLLPGLSLGVVTTLIGYLAFLVVPIPGFHQMAVFSAVGVAAAFITVILWLPLLERRRRRLPTTGAPSLAAWFWRFWEAPRARPWRAALLILLALGGIVGATRLSATDDIRAMQFLSQDLLRQQAAIRKITGSTAAVQHFLVRAPDGETALQREEALIERLSGLRAEGTLAGFQAPAQFVPSAARQRENQRLVQERLMAPHLARHLDRLGLPEAPASRGGSARMLTLDAAAESFPLLRRMILPVDAGEAVHVVLLETPLDPARVAAAASGIEGIRFVDPAADISRVLAEYRRWAIVILGASALAMLLLLALRYRLSGALRVMAPPVAGIVLAPALVALGGDSFTFFDALALILVLAISVDYAVFCAEAADDQKTWTMLAVALAATTTLLSFGALAFSRVPAVQSFGLTIILGIGIAFLLAPAAGGVGRRRSARGP